MLSRVSILVLCVAAAASAASAPRRAQSANSTYFEAAVQAANWIVAVAEPSPIGTGIYWPPSLTGQASASYNRTFDLYSGVAGCIVYLLEAFNATGNETYMSTAVAAAQYLAAAVPEITASGTSSGLYHGGATGMVFALDVLGQFPAARTSLLQYVLNSQAPDGSMNSFTGLRWGTSGIILYLVQAYMSSPGTNANLLAVAQEAARYVISQGVPANGGLKWYSGFGPDVEAPNYAEGTSGVAYALAALYNVTQNQTYLQAALAGGTYLFSIANTTGGRCLIYHDNMTPGLFYLANCNGNSGTGRFFLRMHELTGNATWLNYAYASAKGIQDLAPYGNTFNFYVIFGQQPNPFWNNVGLCDGASAAVVYFMTLYQLYGDGQYLQWARKIADDILSRATVVVPGEQLQWITVEWRTNPSTSTGPQVGYMQGAAGVGSTMLWLDSIVNGTPNPHIWLPDDLFALQ